MNVSVKYRRSELEQRNIMYPVATFLMFSFSIIFKSKLEKTMEQKLKKMKKLDLSLAKFIDICLLINIVNFVLLILVKLGYFGTCPGGWGKVGWGWCVVWW